MALEQFKTQILLLHSEQSTLDSLSSGFNDRYTVLCENSRPDALTTLGETPIHIIVSAQELPGMSGLDALREAKKRSPETIGILLAGDKSEGLQALVGEQEVFQIVRGGVTPDALRSLIDAATRQQRLLALADSANDTTADVDEPGAEHIIMETSANGSTIISDGSARLPILDPKKISSNVSVGTRAVDVLVLTKDEEFLATIRDSSRGLHKVHYANTVSQADDIVRAQKVGVAVIDAAMVGQNVEKLTLHLRTAVPRLVAIVAGRRDDGEMLMDLINRGKVYRFLLKPVSPGRARLAVEASVKHHLEAPDTAFANAGSRAPQQTITPPKPAAKPKAVPSVPAKKPAASEKSAAKSTDKPVARPLPVIAVSPDTDRLSDAFDGDDTSFTETMTGLVTSIGESIAGFRDSISSSDKEEAAAKPESDSVVVEITPPSASAESPVDSPVSDSSGGSLLQNPKILGIGAFALIAVAGLGFWMFGGTSEPAVEPIAAESTPQFAEAEPEIQIAQPAVEQQLEGAALLEEARLARGAGQIYDPPGSNAIELFMAAAAASPDDASIAAELNTVIEQALANAESALLERRVDNAEAALSRIALADPDNSRLPFLSAQLSQMQLRTLLDDARLSVRESRFEDATIALAGARNLGTADTQEIDAIEAELSEARSAQRADDVLAQAAARLEEGKLTEPSNDNARYFYELVLSNDAQNSAAQQGLTVVASQLVLQARTQIDRGNFNTAESLLSDARQLDPSSDAVRETSSALTTARDREAEQARQEADRQAADERRVNEQRLAEQQAAAQRVENERLAAEAAVVAAAAAAAAQQTDDVNAAATATDDPAGNNGTAAGMVAVGVAAASIEAPANGAPESGAELAGEVADATAAVAAPAKAEAQSAPEQVAEVIEQSYVLNETPVAISSLKRVRYVAPKYPRAAQRRNVSGWADVVFIVTTDGSVRDAIVTAADPGTTFSAAAAKAVGQWEFEPVLVNGTAVEKRAAVRMMFALE